MNRVLDLALHHMVEAEQCLDAADCEQAGRDHVAAARGSLGVGEPGDHGAEREPAESDHQVSAALAAGVRSCLCSCRIDDVLRQVLGDPLLDQVPPDAVLA